MKHPISKMCAKLSAIAALAAFGAFTIGCVSVASTKSSSSVPVPLAPTGLVATGGNAQVALAWAASTGAISYNVYYSTASGVTATNGTKIAGVTQDSFTLTGLTNGTTYYFVVTALDAGGESAASAPASATAALPAPSGLTATAGIAQVSLSWTAVSGATSYNVYWATATGVTKANGTKIGGVSTPSYTQTGLTNGTTYYYIVTAVNATGESPASSQASASPHPAAPPAPTGLAATAGNAQVSLSWSVVSSATAYTVYYATGSAASAGNWSKVGNIAGPPYTVAGLTNGTLYLFAVTASNAGGESPVSNQASATPSYGITVALIPGTAATGTLQCTPTASMTFWFGATSVSQNATATIVPLLQANLTVPLGRTKGRIEPQVTASDTFIAGFTLSLAPTSISAFNIPVNLSGNVGNGITSGTTLHLAELQNNQWADVTTLVVGADGTISAGFPSATLPGLLTPGSYMLYQPAPGSNTAVTNLGVALLADDGAGMADGSNGLQVVEIYDSNGNLLKTPTVSFLDYEYAGNLDALALTPDGSQGIVVNGGNSLRFFSNVQTGFPEASIMTMSISNFGGTGNSVAILPNGDEAVLTGDAYSNLLVISGILSGKPVPATAISVPSTRDGVVVSTDGTVMLARGPYGLTVYSIAPVPPVVGSLGGAVAHSYTQVADLPALGTAGLLQDGRDGMALSPADSSRAVAIAQSSPAIQLLTGLTSNAPTAGAAVALPAIPYAVSISPDGKLAIVGTKSGLLMFSGVDTGALVQVGALYSPAYALGSGSVNLGLVSTLGITLDGKNVVAGDRTNRALVVIPYTSAGFASAPASVLGAMAIPGNDQLVSH
jgi:fibronectin type 3 domain-containing protein